MGSVFMPSRLVIEENAPVWLYYPHHFINDIDHPAFAAFRALSIDKLDWLRDFDPTIDPSGEHQNSGPYTGPSLDDFNDSHGGTSTGFWGNVGSSINEKLEYNLQSLANSHGGRSTGNGLPVE